MLCTWEGCTKEAARDQRGKDGDLWAMLCMPHHAMLDTAIDAMDVKKIMAYWVKAQGGPQAAAKRMMET